MCDWSRIQTAPAQASVRGQVMMFIDGFRCLSFWGYRRSPQCLNPRITRGKLSFLLRYPLSMAGGAWTWCTQHSNPYGPFSPQTTSVPHGLVPVLPPAVAPRTCLARVLSLAFALVLAQSHGKRGVRSVLWEEERCTVSGAWCL